MMGAFAAWMLKSRTICAAVVLLVLGLAGWAGKYALTVGQDDDLLAFLPVDNPEVKAFRSMAKQFGSLDVAIVALKTDDPFADAFITQLGTLTRKLNTEPAIGFAMSLNNTEDFEKNKVGGITTRYLLRDLPKTPADRERLRELVLSKRHIVGNLIAPDGKSVLVYAFLAPGANPRQTATLIRTHVSETFPDTTAYWGGAPFISTYIYDVTQTDMERLIPWAVMLIILIIVVSFRDVLGALLALGSTGIGIVFTYGLMGRQGINANIVLSAMPVILFAVGSAYAIHIMVRYYALRKDRESDEAMIDTLTQIGPTVLAAGLTTVAGLFSFMAMDIEPMRQFGMYTGIGILATLLLSVTFVPAVVTLLNVKARDFRASVYEQAVHRIVAYAQVHRRTLMVALAVVVLGGGAVALRVEARMENAAFFAPGSPPDQAETFLRDNYGGSLFIQVMVEGDMLDPAVLRELQHTADNIELLPHVTSTNHIGTVLALANEALAGERRLPTRVGQVGFIYHYLAGRPAIEQLLHPDKKRALIHAKIDTDNHEAVAELLESIEALVSDTTLLTYRVVGRAPAGADNDRSVPVTDEERAALDRRAREQVATRIRVGLKRLGIPAPPKDKLNEALESEFPPVNEAAVAKYLEKYLTSAESLLEQAAYVHAPALAKSFAKIPAKPEAFAYINAARDIMAILPELSDECAEVKKLRDAKPPTDDGDDDDDDDDDATEDPCVTKLIAYEEQRDSADAVAQAMPVQVTEARRRVSALQAANAVATSLGLQLSTQDLPELLGTIADALLDLHPSEGIVGGGKKTISHEVSGVPVLYRGLSRSVTENQWKSLGMALGLVLLILMALFRSVTRGLIAAVPTVVTLIAIYGLMGATGMHLDIGTSMLASIIIGAGVDYAVHLMAAWEGETATEAGAHAAQHSGPAITTNALMVAAGFFVLTLGDAKPLQNVGRLTAAAMIIAGLATFVFVPALSGWLGSKKPVEPAKS